MLTAYEKLMRIKFLNTERGSPEKLDKKLKNKVFHSGCKNNIMYMFNF